MPKLKKLERWWSNEPWKPCPEDAPEFVKKHWPTEEEHKKLNERRERQYQKMLELGVDEVNRRLGVK